MTNELVFRKPERTRFIMNSGTSQRTTRREALCQAGTGLGMLGLFGLLGDSGYLGRTALGTEITDRKRKVRRPRGSLMPRTPHFPAKAKHIIHIYIEWWTVAGQHIRPQAALEEI